MGNSKRTRNWICVVYPESVPENWISILDDFQIEYVISPLHDKDINVDGQPKKEHYHILLMFDSVKSYDQVKFLTDDLNGTIPIPCNSVKGTVRYFCHLDNPEKAQYSLKDIRCHGGFDLEDLLALSSSQTTEISKQIFSFCRENHIVEYSILLDYCLLNGKDEWFYVATKVCTLSIKTYLSSMRHRMVV